MWELYGPDDWTQAHDLAAEQPDRLRDLQRLFLIEAVKYNVLPLDDRRYERFNAELAGRPQLVTGNSQLLFPGMGRLSENSVIVLKNKSVVDHRVDHRPRRRRQRRARRPGRHLRRIQPSTSTRVDPPYCYNLLGIQQFKIYGDDAVPPGDHQVRAEFAYDGDGLAKGGDLTLYVDGTQVGNGRIDATQPMIFSADETTDVGNDSATPVSDDYGPKNSTFTGRIHWIQLDAGTDDNNHLITPDERLRVAMARQ